MLIKLYNIIIDGKIVFQFDIYIASFSFIFKLKISNLSYIFNVTLFML